jgi:hypothetical protein
LVERLRQGISRADEADAEDAMYGAADEIERLHIASVLQAATMEALAHDLKARGEEIRRLRTALKEIADHPVCDEVADFARAALEQKP